ncbi:S8 family serine peptidase [Yoonia sp. 2307UL14-13]|uniref:S8 family serine peptidase n=1 Tax=Yoonia sp. 2307UL14-13 TaxID=3126506 RepID=UPI0030B37F0F
MIATETFSTFAGLLNNMDQFAQPDTIRSDVGDYDASLESDPALAFLSDGAMPDDLSQTAVIGIIDDAVPFANQRLTIGGKDARLAGIWMQDGAVKHALHPGIGADLPFGTELRGAQISGLLDDLVNGRLADEEAIYRKAGVVDFSRGSTQSAAFFGNHGAAVADLAAGFSPDDALARNFPVMAVSLPPEVTRDTLGTFAPVYILTAILYLIQRTRRLCKWLESKHGSPVRLPLIINISYGILAGAKDGSSLVERFQDAVSDNDHPEVGPIHFVLPMGNHRQSQTHAVLQADGADKLDWELKPDDNTPSFVEIWGPMRDSPEPPEACMQLVLGRGAGDLERTGFTTHGTFEDLRQNGRPAGRAYLQYRRFGGGGREVVTLAMYPTLPSLPGADYVQPGLVRIGAVLPDGDAVDAYIQRDDSIRRFRSGGRQSKFLDPGYQTHDPAGRELPFDQRGADTSVIRAGTVNAFACGFNQIRVGGTYGDEDTVDGQPTGDVVHYSGLGLVGDGRIITGDVTAPADRSRIRPGIVTMGALSGSRQAVSGTSMSAPSVTMSLARILAEQPDGFEVTPQNIAAVLRGGPRPRTAGPQNTKGTKRF